MPPTSADTKDRADLSEEIALVRRCIQHLADTPDDLKVAALMVRMLEALTRMVNVQARLRGRGSDDLADLNELVRQRLVAGGYEPPV